MFNIRFNLITLLQFDRMIKINQFNLDWLKTLDIKFMKNMEEQTKHHMKNEIGTQLYLRVIKNDLSRGVGDVINPLKT